LFAAISGKLILIQPNVNPAMPESEPHSPFPPAPRHLPVGGELLPGGGAHFRVWSPERRRMEVVFEPEDGGTGRQLACVELMRDSQGYFSGFAAEARDGDRYRLRLDGDPNQTFPDPVSRFQPSGPFGPSQLIDPTRFAWSDAAWPGVTLAGQVIYELHVGTFTREGTWQAARRELAELAAAGITLLEVMPVADFPGQFGWGYDGVNPFAPTRLYGRPDDFREFVDDAHAHRIGVLLDVVYNHFGAVGNFTSQFSPYYVSDRHQSEWGDAYNYDGPNSAGLREYVLANVRYWIEEFHLDGLRLDATQAFYDESPEHILCAVSRAARRAAGRSVVLLGENEPQQTRMVRPCAEGGHGLDALWNDDFHHTALVRATGCRDAYYSDHAGSPEEFIALAKWGFLYQGQLYSWQAKPRGTSTRGLAPATFINFIENHDQLANSARGQRVWQRTSPGRFRALTAYLLLSPGTPLLFQGQEFSASTPFLYFADSGQELAEQVAASRAKFLGQFRTLALAEAQSLFSKPSDRATFERCRLDFSERARHAASYALHRDLIQLRKSDPVLRRQSVDRLHGARLSDDAFLLRHLDDEVGDRLLVFNFGAELSLRIVPEPLLAPPPGGWQIAWSSESPAYGGDGTPRLETAAGWRIPAEAAVLLCGAP
jgi:maltooligosyltrehalose trehalohydrolase